MVKPDSHFTRSAPDFQDLLEEVASKPMGKDRINALASGATTLTERIIAFGNEAYKRIGNRNSQQEEDRYVEMAINYSWSLTAKANLLLWRDIIFRHHQAILGHEIGEVSKEELAALGEKSMLILEQAGQELVEKAIPAKLSVRQMSKLCKTWALESNPWPVYRDQVNALTGQCADLVTANTLLRQLTSLIASLGKSIDQTLDLTIQDLNALHAHLEQVEEDLAAIPEKITKTAIQKVLARIESAHIFSRGAISGNPFSDILEKFLLQMPDNLLIPMDLRAGQILTQEIRLRRSFRTWFEAELMPLLYEVMETRDEHHSGTAIVLTNLKNRLLPTLEAPTNVISSQQRLELQQSVRDRRNGLQPARESMTALREEAMNRYSASTSVRDMQRAGRSFLAMPLEASLQRMSDQSSALSALVANRFRKTWAVILSWQRRARREVALSVGERLLRFIKIHTPDPDSEMYTSLFLTGGFVGDALLVSRQSELKRVQHCLREWREGYRGTVLLTGGRYSGKTMFVESFVRNHFPSTTIRLQPGQPIILAGRTFNSSCDLEPALDFIGKYALQSKALIWIDDLENWSEAGASLHRNVRHLIRFMDSYSQKLFFIISTNRTLLPHLDRHLGLSNSCQTIIHLDQLDVQNLQKAILIRHGATHKTLIDDQGHAFETDHFIREIRQLYRYTQGSIGIALYLWASRIRIHGDQEVRLAEVPTQSLPMVIDHRNFPLFRVLLLYRQINEYRLRKLFGPCFDVEISPLVRRWLSLGVLSRSPEGWLEIHPIVAFELVKQLERFSAEPLYSESTLTAYGTH